MLWKWEIGGDGRKGRWRIRSTFIKQLKAFHKGVMSQAYPT